MTDAAGKTPHKKISFHRMVPNMLTIAALCSGMTSIKFAISSKWEAAVIAIVIAAFIDGFDGAAARLLKAQSKLGAELDSLSDFLCFGVAPAIVLYLWTIHDAGRIGWYAALAFCVAVALRLARFNAVSKDQEKGPKTDNPLTKYFTGIPSPAGAGLAILPMIIHFQLPDDTPSLASAPLIVGPWMLLIAALMVSRLPTFSSKQLRLPHRMMTPALAFFALLFISLINEPWPTLTLLGALYIAGIPLSIVHYGRARRKFTTATPVDDDEALAAVSEEND